MFEPTFGRCKIQNHSSTFSQDVYPGEGTFQHYSPEWLNENFELECFGYLTKNRAFQIFRFCVSSFVTKKLYVDPRKTLFLGWDELASLGLRAVSQRLNTTVTNFDI